MSVIRALVAIPTTLFAMVLVLPVVALALPFWAVTILTRAINRMLEPSLASWVEIIEYDAAIGWKPKSDLDKYYVAARKVSIGRVSFRQFFPFVVSSISF